MAKDKKTHKLSVYMSDEVESALTELYITRYRKDRKITRSDVAAEAILALYEKEVQQQEQ